jgi:outer membrane lipopolysaccharide assembly protein LptE/RlpB
MFGDAGTAARTAAVMALVLAGGCGYRLVGATSNLPEHLARLYVAPLVNQSGKAELDQRLTEEVTQEWVRRGRFQLVDSAEKADAVLSGSVTAVISTPVRFDDQGRASEYQLSVVTDVQLVDRSGSSPIVLWHDARFMRSVSYQVDINSEDYFDREVEAIDRLSRDFARALVVSVLEGF